MYSTHRVPGTMQLPTLTGLSLHTYYVLSVVSDHEDPILREANLLSVLRVLAV